jgi:AcrR family transcriptional regulator
MCQNATMTQEEDAAKRGNGLQREQMPPAPGARRRGGRRAGSTASREKILDVARLAFPANGYAGTSLRGIARDAGVDPSLVVQYFGSKAGLFAAAVEWPFDADRVAAEVHDVPPADVGYYMARVFLEHWDHDEERNPIISSIYAALADPAAAAMVREFITANLALPVVTRAGGDRPQLRASLLAAQLIGFGLSRYVLSFEALASTPSEELTSILGAMLQHTCASALE